MTHSTTREEFKAVVSKNSGLISQKGAFVPIIVEQLADMATPVSLFTALQNRTDCHSRFIYESVEGVAQNGRYSFIGFNPFLMFSIEGQQAKTTVLDKVAQPFLSHDKEANPLEQLKSILASINIIEPAHLPRLISGAVGYLGYDTIRLHEEIPAQALKDNKLPEGMLGFYNNIIIFDNKRKTVMFVHAVYVKPGNDLDKLFESAQGELQKMTEMARLIVNNNFEPVERKVVWGSNLSKAQYKQMVLKAKEYIAAGDIFQVVLSQRFKTEFSGNPLHLYRVLRIINPSPYLYFIDFEDFKIIGSSPELLVRIEEDNVATRPIAGTRPRGTTEQEDRAFEEELMADKKELAEHLMLVDLGRNDLGRVCTFGSVHVQDMMRVERYSHVMHIVSDVIGKRREELSPVDILYATFPAGTLSGAPKIRAMEIIDDLEPTARGVYGGAIGYFDFGGNMDWCIAIRTMVLEGDNLTIQAGAGVVADSDPHKEFEETENKARALQKTVLWA